MKITVELLKKYSACSEGVRWFQRNNLNGFPVDLLEEIKGDFNNYVYWIKDELNKKTQKKEIKQFERIEIGQYWREYTYDSFGNILTYKNSDGYLEEYTRDSFGNVLTYKNSNGEWCEYTRDSNGNVLTYKNSNGSWYEYTRDSNGNKLIVKDSNGYCIKYLYEYFEDGQLHKMFENGRLIITIPFFEKGQ